MKHTPGPWAVEINEQDDPRITPYRIKADEYLIAMGCLQAQETEANARLIAAAPELAEFVGKVIKWKHGDSIEALQKEAEALYEQAIAKAEKGGE